MSKRVAALLTLAAALLGGPGQLAPVQAQSPLIPRPASTPGTVSPAPAGMGFFTVGWQRLDLADLNAHLQAAGYPEFGEDFVSIGGSAWGVRQRVLVGGEGYALLAPSEATEDGQLRTRLTGGYGMFNLGYVLVSGRRTSLFPGVGFGAGAVVLDLLDRGAPTFDEVLQNPRRSARLSSGALLVDTSLGLTSRLTHRPARTRGGAGGIAVGVRAGYTLAPFTTEWRTDAGNDVAGGPDVSPQGPYVRVMVGGWGAQPRRR